MSRWGRLWKIQYGTLMLFYACACTEQSNLGVVLICLFTGKVFCCINAIEGRSSKAGNFTGLRIVTYLLYQSGNTTFTRIAVVLPCLYFVCVCGFSCSLLPLGRRDESLKWFWRRFKLPLNQ